MRLVLLLSALYLWLLRPSRKAARRAQMRFTFYEFQIQAREDKKFSRHSYFLRRMLWKHGRPFPRNWRSQP